MKPEMRALLRGKSFLLHFLPAIIVLISFLAVTISAYYSAQETVAREHDRVVGRRMNEAEVNIERQLSTYEELLKGSAGLFAASQSVSRAEWARYVSLYQLEENYPGAVGVGYIEVLRPGELSSFLNTMHNEEGLPDYKIWPVGRRDIYMPITYIEPRTPENNKVVGFDMTTEPIRYGAIEEARDSGTIAYSGKIDLLQDSDKKERAAGFLAFIPVYENGRPKDTVAQRRAAIHGFAYVPIRALNLFEGILPRDIDRVGFKVYVSDQSPGNLMFKSKNYESITSQLVVENRTLKMNVHNIEWIVEFNFAETVVSESIRGRPLVALASGILLSLVTSGLVFVLLLARSRSMLFSKEREIQDAKDDLLSLASHQLRTPATGVKQYIGMILEGYAGSLNKQQQMYLEKAYESNERQLHIINDLLYVAKADAGRIVLAKRAIKVNELVKDVVSEQRHTANDKNIVVKLKLPAKDRTAYADKHCLRMAIENLLSNAIKYTPEGGRIRVSVAHQSQSLLISIKDNGVGVKEEDIQLLFNRFSRIPNSMSDHTSGSGIGLYLAKQLIELHEGTITVESEVDKGTTFTICMPYKK